MKKNSLASIIIISQPINAARDEETEIHASAACKPEDVAAGSG